MTAAFANALPVHAATASTAHPGIPRCAADRPPKRPSRRPSRGPKRDARPPRDHSAERDRLLRHLHTDKLRAGAEDEKDASQIAREDEAIAAALDDKGFLGWREEDDDAWRQFRAREMSFRGPVSFTAADLESPPQPLGRDGQLTRYPAASRFDFDKSDWVPTTEEEEQRLRNPKPVRDPYFVRLAKSKKEVTSLRDQPAALAALTKEERSRAAQQDDVVMRGFGKHGHRPPPVDEAHLLRRRPLKMALNAWRVVHLGTSSAIPTKKRNVSSTAFLARLGQPPGKFSGTDTATSMGADGAVDEQDEQEEEPSMFLVDVGESTVRQLLRCDWCLTHGFRWIRAIFITHLHGDHIYGLPALLSAIGRYVQHRRRASLEALADGADEKSDPVIRIFGPPGTRGFVRASLHWTRPVGVRFAISELVARDGVDFTHLSGFVPVGDAASPQIRVGRIGDTSFQVGSGLDLKHEAPPPLDEEVRAEDVCAAEDGLWHVWSESGPAGALEVVSAPLMHRVPCFGYVFRETTTPDEQGQGPNATERAGRADANGELEIDMDKARALGVRGRQYGVLRNGRSVTVSATGQTVTPDDVRAGEADATVAGTESATSGCDNDSSTVLRKVTLLGDTCDSSAIADAARDSDLLMHEATFTQREAGKARVAMHSTAGMAGAFAREINARKLVLTHFSSRYEFMLAAQAEEEDDDDADWEEGGSVAESEGAEAEDDDEDLSSPNELVAEAVGGYGDDAVEIVAAVDLMEHDVAGRVLGAV